jgi:hypothetical protein
MPPHTCRNAEHGNTCPSLTERDRLTATVCAGERRRFHNDIVVPFAAAVVMRVCDTETRRFTTNALEVTSKGLSMSGLELLESVDSEGVLGSPLVSVTVLDPLHLDFIRGGILDGELEIVAGLCGCSRDGREAKR